MFFGCRASGEKNDFKSYNNGDYAVIIPYSPTNAQGKREVHTVYAKTREECEILLEKMIAEVRERIIEEKRRMKGVAGISEHEAQ